MCVDDAQRRLAIAELLIQPDPPELRRGHRIRVEGKPDRFALLPKLAAIYVQARLLALEERRTATVEKVAERQDVCWELRSLQEEVQVAA